MRVGVIHSHRTPSVCTISREFVAYIKSYYLAGSQPPQGRAPDCTSLELVSYLCDLGTPKLCCTRTEERELTVSLSRLTYDVNKDTAMACL